MSNITDWRPPSGGRRGARQSFRPIDGTGPRSRPLSEPRDRPSTRVLRFPARPAQERVIACKTEMLTREVEPAERPAAAPGGRGTWAANPWLLAGIAMLVGAGLGVGVVLLVLLLGLVEVV